MAPTLFWLLLTSVFAYALIWGGREHRLAAAGCLIATFASRLVRPSGTGDYDRVETGLLWVDMALFALFLAIALRSNRFWPLWVAGFHLVTLAAHGLRAVKIDLIPKIYAVAAQFWSYPVLLVIALAVWRARQRESAAVLPRDAASV